MSIHKEAVGVYKIRWRLGGRNKSLRVYGSLALARKILHKKLADRAESRHLDILREISYPMSRLIDRYWDAYGSRKISQDREKAVIEGIRDRLGKLFVREVDGQAVDRWLSWLKEEKGLSASTVVRHFNVMHHLMKKASTIWTAETGIDRNPADLVEIKRPNEQRERFLSAEEIKRLKKCLDQRMYSKDGNYESGFSKVWNRRISRLRLIVLTALTTGMRLGEIFQLKWSDILYAHGLIAVRAMLKGGKVRYVPLLPQLDQEFRHYPPDPGEALIFPPRSGTKGERQRVEKSFHAMLRLAGIEEFRFHDLRHTFASWYMMHGGDLYELAKILGHSNIRTTERYAKLGKNHIARTGSTAREMWKLIEGKVKERGSIAD